MPVVWAVTELSSDALTCCTRVRSDRLAALSLVSRPDPLVPADVGADPEVPYVPGMDRPF
jgi:hypothetical protein